MSIPLNQLLALGFRKDGRQLLKEMYEVFPENTGKFEEFMFDLEKIKKDTIKMPVVASEDTATWWKVLRSGYTAYGLDEVLTVYRRPAGSLSANKLVAIKRIWNLYRNVEKLPLACSMWNFVWWAFRATLRRI